MKLISYLFTNFLTDNNCLNHVEVNEIFFSVRFSNAVKRSFVRIPVKEWVCCKT